MKIAVICHIFKSDIFWKDIEPRLKNIGQDFDLYVSFTDNENRDKDICKLKQRYPNCYIGIVPNVGEDLRGFFHCLNHIFDDNKEYDIILKVHTKTNNSQRNNLLNVVLSKNTPNNINLMHNMNEFGMYGKKLYRYTLTDKSVSKYSNDALHSIFYEDKENMIDMCKKIHCKTLCWDFFGGTMFWINFGLLKKYFGNHQIDEDYFFEPYARGGLRAHAGERIFGCICHDSGLKIYDETTLK